MCVLVRVFVCVCVCVSSYCNAFTLGGADCFHTFGATKKTPMSSFSSPLFILRVNHATDYRSYCASQISHRPKDAFNAFGRISSPKPLEFRKETNTWEKRQRKKSIHLNELFFPQHTQRCNIFTNMYTDKYKKLFRLTRIIIIIPRFPSLLFLIFLYNNCLVNERDGALFPPLFPLRCGALSPTSQGSNGLFLWRSIKI